MADAVTFTDSVITSLSSLGESGDSVSVSDSVTIALDGAPGGARLVTLNMVIAETFEVSADMNFCIGPTDAFTGYLSNQLGVLIAEERTLGVVLDINKILGINAFLDVLVQASADCTTALQVNIKSTDLRVGASAIYNPDGDEVESILYVEDNEILHPEFVEQMTATLLFKSQHDLGSTSFDRNNGVEDGTIQNFWIHPPHVEDLSIRFLGTIDGIGDVDFTIPVVNELDSDVPLGEATLEGVDIVAPRTEPSTYMSQTHELDAAPDEIAVLSDQIQLVLLKLNLLDRYEFLEIGNSPLTYEGGGNRLLASLENNGTFVLQPKNVFPPTINAHTNIEEISTNLLNNSDFLTPTSSVDPVPLGWTLTAPSSVTLLPALQTEASGAGIFLSRQFGSGPYSGPKTVVFSHDDAVTTSDTDPVSLSILARTEIRPESVVRDLRLVISFRDVTDTELSKQVAEFDPQDIEGPNFVLLQHNVSTPPAGTVTVRVSVELESIEASDDITLYMMAPQLENNTAASSRIIGSAAPVNRSTDVLRIVQENNIEFSKGSIITIFAPDYQDTPEVDGCLFDTRDASGLNGFAAFHLANGRLRFMVAGPVSAVTLDTNLPYNFQPGIFQDVTVSWEQSYMRIEHNGEVVAVDTSVTVLPQAFNEWIYFFRTTAGTALLNGELASFEIHRDFET